MIAIIDYGLGNLGSISNMLKVIGEKNIITSDANQIEAADKLILPGVGAFDAGMENLNRDGLADLIREQAQDKKKPILGICLGMQLLGRKSEEGKEKGLALIPFDNVKFRFDHVKIQSDQASELKVPHMGWDVVNFKMSHPLIDGLEEQQRYYFVHSYHAVCDRQENILMTSDYGYEFAAAVVNDHVMGVQFHPEKSHDFGMALLENFAKKC